MEKRRNFKPEEKANIVLEMLREEKTIAQIAAEYQIHPNVLHRWKADALENLHTIFSKETNEADKLRKQHEAEKDELVKQIGQLTIEVNWLKKKSAEINQRRRRT